MTNDSSSYENIIEIDGLHLKYLLFLFLSLLCILKSSCALLLRCLVSGSGKGVSAEGECLASYAR